MLAFRCISVTYFNRLGFSILSRVLSYLQQGEISGMNHRRWNLVLYVWSNVFSDCFCYKRVIDEKFGISSRSDRTECSATFVIDSKLISDRCNRFLTIEFSEMTEFRADVSVFRFFASTEHVG